MNFDGRSPSTVSVPRFLGTEESCQIETASRVIARPLSVARACNRRYPLSEKKVIREGLYVFDAGALGPRCGTVTLSLHSEAHPALPAVIHNG